MRSQLVFNSPSVLCRTPVLGTVLPKRCQSIGDCPDENHWSKKNGERVKISISKMCWEGGDGKQSAAGVASVFRGLGC